MGEECWIGNQTPARHQPYGLKQDTSSLCNLIYSSVKWDSDRTLLTGMKKHIKCLAERLVYSKGLINISCYYYYRHRNFQMIIFTNLPTTKPARPAGTGRTSSPTPSGPNPSTHPHMPSLTTMSPAKVPGALISPLATYQVLLLTHDSPTELDCLSPAKQNHTKALSYLPD